MFKVLAMGAPYVKAVCLGRAIMIPGMVGKNIGEWLKEGKLPRTVSQFGTSVEEIFVTYETLKAKYGSAIEELPLGAIGWYTYVDKLKVGLQQLMAGSRNFSLPSISRNDLMALTREAEDVTGIPYVMDAYRAEAEAIINGYVSPRCKRPASPPNQRVTKPVARAGSPYQTGESLLLCISEMVLREIPLGCWHNR